MSLRTVALWILPSLAGAFVFAGPAAPTADAASPAASTGTGNGVVTLSQDDRTGGCDQLLFNADGTYENGYAWQYGGVVTPDFGSFAECYPGNGLVCGGAFDFSQTGNAPNQTMDVYVWDDDAGEPGPVVCVLPAVDPGTVAFWPSLSRHVVDLPNCVVGSQFWVGYWSNWPEALAGWFVGADLDGFGGCPMTKIAPGIGYPTGWNDVSIVWGPTQAIGIGAYLADGGIEGACCYSDGSCLFQPFADCSGDFQGGGIPCDPNPCPQPGACCFEDGSCVQLVPIDCTAQGGEWIGELPCDPNPCSQPVACCFEDGSCSLLLAGVCTSLGGTPDPEEMACDPNPCPQPFGACCFDDDSCVMLEILACSGAGGTFLGDGISCDPNPCTEPGACCLGDDCSLLAGAICLADDGIFFGPGSECTPGLCFTVSCDGDPIPLRETGIEPDPTRRGADRAASSVGGGRGTVREGRAGDCGILTMHSDGTYENGYIWQAGGLIEPCFGSFAEGYTDVSGTICSAVFDFTQTGAADGRTMDVYLWDDAGGNPGAVLEVQVAVDPGPIALWPSVSRHVVSYDAQPPGSSWWVGYWGNWPLEGVGGWFIGADLDGPVSGNSMTLIAPGIGYPTGWNDVSIVWGPTQSIGIGAEVVLEGAGACCLPNGDCFITTEDTCEGEFLVDENCDPNPCEQPLDGACCFEDGTCLVFDSFECADAGGDYFGDEITCDPNPCPQPLDGACCFDDGTCLVLVSSDCADAGGDYFGDDTACEPNPCPQPVYGACCFDDGTCLVLVSSDCADAGGDYFGDDTACEPNPCPQPVDGACCFDDGTCLVLVSSDCADAGGDYFGDDTACEPNPCPQPVDGACCFDDGTCLVLVSSDCADAGGDYFGDDTACEPNPCPQPLDGACCFGDGSCVFVDTFECDDLGGNFLGEEIACDPNPCPPPGVGGCCVPGSGCVILQDFACEDAGGTYLGDDTDCDGVVCGVPCIPPANDYDPVDPGRGPNAGGTLILHSDPGTVYTSDDEYCGTSGLQSCTDAFGSTDVRFESVVVHAFAAFYSGASPRVAGVTFGLSYADCLVLEAWGSCGDFELATSGWPASGEGTAVTWGTAETGSLTEVYWIAAYVYSLDATTLDLIPHPTQGAFFADDDVPSNLDPIAALGSFGFGMDGSVPCPVDAAPGACCFADGSCEVVFVEVCDGAGGVYLGDATSCDPNPCPQPSTGACCLEDDCVILTEAECEDAPGDYLGDEVPCDPNPCFVVDGGACCFEDGSCQVLTIESCEAAGGEYMGDGLPCDPNPCAPVPVIDESWGRIKERFRN